MASGAEAFRPVLAIARRYGAGLALAALVAFFGVLKLYCFNFVNGDEHTYFYMGLMVSRGEWPYRDFFFSHPPLQLYLLAPLYALFGYSLVLSKAVPNVAAIVSALFVYRIGRLTTGKLEGVVAAALFLLTFDVLRGSSHFTGANCALAFGMAGAYAAWTQRPLLAGLLFTAGTFIGVYIAPLALMLIVLIALRSPKESLRLLLGYAAGCALVCLVFASVAGQAFWYQVFTYNLDKAPMPYSWFVKFRNVFYLNTPVMLGFVPAVFWGCAMWATRGRAAAASTPFSGSLGALVARLNLWGDDRVAPQMIFCTFVLGYFFFYSTRVDYYSYYFMLVMPWMALMTAYVICDVPRFLLRLRAGGALPSEGAAPANLSRADARRAKRAKLQAPAGASLPLWPLAGCALVLLGVLAYRHSIGRGRIEEMGSEPSSYAWRDSRYLGSALNRIVRSLFWTPVNAPARLASTIARYLQHETLASPTIDGFVEGVRRECKPGERIFGEYSLGPFAASVGDCVLAANLADTNPHRWKVLESSPEQWVAALTADHLDIAVVKRGDAMLKQPAMRDFLLGTFPRVVFTWDDPYVGHVELRRRAS